MTAILTTAIGHTAIGVTILIIGALLQSVYWWGFESGRKAGMKYSVMRLLSDVRLRQEATGLLRRSLRPGARRTGLGLMLQRRAAPLPWADPRPTPVSGRWGSSIGAV